MSWLFRRPHRIFLLCLIVCAVATQICVLQSSYLINHATYGDAAAVSLNPKLRMDTATDSAGTTTTSSTIRSIEQGPIFYNLFVPHNKNGRDTERIVKEQLLQRRLTSPNATIRYTLIGDTSFQEFVFAQCHDCQCDQSIEVGDEQHTLQSLWDYCQKIPTSSDGSDVLVTYIHDKGSFHRTEANEKARRMATKAAMECRSIMPSKTQLCNVCMGAFHIFPQYLASAK